MPQEKWLRKTYKTFKPDMVLALTQELDEELLSEMKSAGIRTVAWWGDPPANMRKAGLLVDHWDHIFIKDKYAAFKLNTLDISASYLPEAMNPDWHVKCYSRIGNEICFAGNAYNYRHYLIRKLHEAGIGDVMLYGDRPPRWASEVVKKAYTGKFIVKKEKSRVFGESLACINSTSMAEGDSLNCRAFEIAGAAGLQIIEYRPAVEDCFEPGKELLVYRTIEELIDCIQRAKKDRNGVERIRLAGYERAKAEHTYEHRLKHIIGKAVM
jgi:spore maturation protein CgeB